MLPNISTLKHSFLYRFLFQFLQFSRRKTASCQQATWDWGLLVVESGWKVEKQWMDGWTERCVGVNHKCTHNFLVCAGLHIYAIDLKNPTEREKAHEELCTGEMVWLRNSMLVCCSARHQRGGMWLATPDATTRPHNVPVNCIIVLDAASGPMSRLTYTLSKHLLLPCFHTCLLPRLLTLLASDNTECFCDPQLLPGTRTATNVLTPPQTHTITTKTRTSFPKRRAKTNNNHDTMQHAH